MFRVGDFVEDILNTNPNNRYGLVYKISDGWPHVIFFESSARRIEELNEIAPAQLDKVNPDYHLKEKAVDWLNWVYDNKWIDNLTYIEILAVIKENAK